MQYVTIPKDIIMVADDGSRVMVVGESAGIVTKLPPQKFVTWLLSRLKDPQLRKTADDLEMNADIKTKIRECDKPWIGFSDMEHKYFAPAIDEPTGGYADENGLADQWVPFIRAFRNPGSKKPAVKRSSKQKATMKSKRKAAKAKTKSNGVASAHS